MAYPPRLNRKQASAYLLEHWGIRRAPTTLAKDATQGGGPRFQKDGNTPLYQPADLDAFAESRLSPSYSSTSEYPSRKRPRTPQG